MLLFLSVLCRSLQADVSSATFPTGNILERIQLLQIPEQSYALYLPRSYDPAKKWPVLYCLDARSRGKLPVALFRDAAELYGWILVGSNNAASDDPELPLPQILNALWDDTHARFSIDEKRVYVTGFSGTARIACEMGIHFKGRIAGVIGCGAGFPYELPAQIPFAYYGVVGDTDFNYLEMKQLRSKLEKVQVPDYHIRTFHGGHEWPANQVCSQAVEWMELLAIRNGGGGQTQTTDAIFSNRLALAESFRAEGNLAEAAYQYSGIVKDFGGLKETVQAQAVNDQLSRSKELAKYVHEEEKREARELAYQLRLGNFIGSMLEDSGALPPVAKMLSDLQVNQLKREASGGGSPEEKRSAQRMLENTLVQTYFYLPRELLKKGNRRAAIASLSVAKEIDPKNPNVWYALARLYAQSGDKQKALESLRVSIENGFQDADRLAQDESFVALAEDSEFVRLLQMSRQK